MDEIRQVSEDVMIREALKWWCYALSSSKPLRSYEKEFLENYSEFKSISEKIYDVFLKEAKRLDRIAEVERKMVALSGEKLQKFVEVATPLIRKALKEKGLAYLYTDEEGRACGTLGIIAYNCKIPNNGNVGENGERLATVFTENIEMFVSRDKIEIRYDENDNFHTIFEITKQENKQENELLQQKMKEYQEKKL